MSLTRTRPPRRGELWLGRPPYLMVAHILAVERIAGRSVVSYELCDEEGAVLELVEHARLDEAWWQTFQPITRRYG